MKKGITLAMCLAFAAVGMLAVGCGEDVHEHNWGSEWEKDSTQHWHACDGCDEKNESANHSGGEATCTEKAECEICGAEYGETLAHAYTVQKYDATNHWMECVCGAKDESSVEEHNGGEATCTEQATCEVCLQAYGEAAEGHTYVVDDKDAEFHWMECTCGEVDEASKEAHAYTVRKFDANDHWYECECGAKDETSVEAHNGGEATCNDPAVCDGCGEGYGEKLEHDYKQKSDDYEHWMECVCGEEKADSRADHTDPNAIGQCDECGYQIEEFEMWDVIDALVASKSLIKQGSTEYHSTNKGGNSANEKCDYVYGNNSLYVKNNYSGYEDYYSLKANGDAFAVRVTSDGPQLCPEVYTADNAKGFRFDPIIIGDTMSFYGAEALIENLYDEANYNANGDLEESFAIVDGKIVGSFSFGFYKKADNYFYKLSVEFKLGENNELVEATVISNKYIPAEYQEVDGKAEPTSTPFYTWTITITQSTEKTIDVDVNAYAFDKVMMTDFKLVTADGDEITDSLTLEAESPQVKLYVQGVTPDTAMANLNPYRATIDGETFDELNDQRLMVYDTTGYVGIKAKKLPGVYEVMIAFGDVEKTITVTVTYAKPTSLKPTVYNGETYEAKTSHTTYVGMSVNINVQANATYADPSFTAEIISGNAADATLTAGELGDYVFTSTTVGEYTVKLTSTANPSITTTLTISVEELPDMGAILSGTYEYAMNLGGRYVVYTAEFTPDEAETASGTVALTWTDQGTVVYTYAYTVAGGLQLTYKSGAENLAMTLVMGEGFNLFLERAGSLYALEKVTSGEGDEGEGDETDALATYEALLSGTYEYSYSGSKINEVIFTPGEKTATELKGSVSIADIGGKGTNTGVYTYVYTAADGLVLTYQSGLADSYNYTLNLQINADMTLAVVKTDKSSGRIYNYVLTKVSDGNGYTEDTGSGDEGGDEATEGVIDVTTTDTYGYFDEYTFKATVSGTYIFTVPAGLGFASKEAYDSFNPAELDFYENTEGGTVKVSLKAGEEYVFYVGALEKNDWQITWSAVEGEVGGDDSGETSNVLTVGSNSINSAETYTFTAEVSGVYVFQNPGGSIMIKVDGTNAGTGIELTAGTTYTITFFSPAGAGTYTVNITAPEAKNVLVIGENSIAVTEDDRTAGGINYTLEVTEEGTYTFASQNLMAVINFADGTSQRAQAYLTAGTYTIGIVTAYVSSAGTYTLTVTYEAPVKENTLVLGENSIAVTEDDRTAGGIDYTFEVTEEGTYKFASSYLMAVINFADGSTQRGQAYLTAGTYTIGVVTAYTSSAGTYTMTITYEAPVVEPSEPDGSSNSPFVIESLPATDLAISATGSGNMDGMEHYTFTVAENGTWMITFDTTDTWFFLRDSNGNIVTSGHGQNTYTATLNAGTYTFAIDTWSDTALDMKASITFEAAVAGGEVVTYISEKHGSGRYLMVEIDEAGKKMTITRSDMTGAFGTGGCTTTVYNIVDGGFEFVSGTSCTIVMNDDGSPNTITWGTAPFTGFAKQ